MRHFLLAAAVHCGLSAALVAAADKEVTYIDLQPKANQKLTDIFGGGREGNDLAQLPKGEQTLAGARFKIGEGLIQLGSKLLKSPKPDKVEGIKVGRAFAKLYILHATVYGNGSRIGQEGMEGDPLFVADGTEIGKYKIHYDDGSIDTIPIVYGKDVRDWWFTETSKGVTRGKVAWKGDNELAKSLSSQIRLYLTTWKNPKPDKKVVSIDYLKAKDTLAAPFCVAMTAEGK